MTIREQSGCHGGYHAYLVRLWQDGPDAPWRALARDAETGEEQRFATLEQLFVYLHRRTQRPTTGAWRDEATDEPRPP